MSNVKQQWSDPDEGSTNRIGPLSPDEESHIIGSMANRISSRVDLNQLILKPNAATLQDVVNRLNEGKDDPSISCCIGELIPAGHIGVISKNGITSVVGPGRYLLPHPRASWESTENVLANNIVQCGPISIIRVPVGEYGLALQGNDPVIISSDLPGYYAVNSPNFRHCGFVPCAQQHVQHGTIHLIRVLKGQYACVWDMNSPTLLPEGIHIIKSEYFRLDRFVSMDSVAFQHGTISRFYVQAGSIGLVWRDQQPNFYTDPGVYLADSPQFQFVQCADVQDREISLGSRKIITVRDGEVGVSHDNGELIILPPGRHVINTPGHFFNEFLSTQQVCLPLDNNKQDQRDGLMICESRELVRIGIAATVFYHIQNPKLAIVKIGDRRNIERFINESATAVITTIIRSTSLAEIAQGGRKGPELKSRAAEKFNQRETGLGDRQDSFDPSSPFFETVREDFLSRLQDNFLKEYGILMLNVRIGDFKVMEPDVAATITNHALITAETQANLANLEGKRQIDLVNKDSDAQIKRIEVEVNAHKLMTRSKAESLCVKEKAGAEADATTVEAEARAKAIRIIAEAEAHATKVRGDAESDRAGKLGSIAFGQEVTLAELQAKMVKESMVGTTKLVFMPGELQKNPFTLFNQDALQGALTHKR